MLTFVSCFAIYQYYNVSNKLASVTSKYDEVKNTYLILENDEKKYREKCENLEHNQNDLIAKKTTAETQNSNLIETNVRLENEINHLKQKIDDINNEKNQFHREKDILLGKLDSMNLQMEDWKKAKEEHINIVKASALEVSGNLSNKLLDDHKREAQNAKKESEEIVKKTTESLIKQHEGLIEKVGALQKGVQKSEEVHRALLNPTGAGSLGEITLENIFKNSGLIKDIDYKMQYSTTGEQGKTLRPDAVVFLPDDNVMVIDSKSSKFFVELESESNSLTNDEINQRLKKMMQENLKGLVSRKYSEAIENEAGRKLARVYMFLPTEKALEKVRFADPSFMQKAWSQGVLPIDPTGLLNELLKSSMVISSFKQDQNAKIIIEKVKELLNSTAILNNHGQKLGASLKKAMGSFDDFAGSFNRTFLSKAKQIQKMGVAANKLDSAEPMVKISNIDGIENMEEKEIFEISEITTDNKDSNF